MLEGKGIHKLFGEYEVLKGIDIAVVPGKITALIGPSGSGKTTLLHALSMLEPPSSGTIILDDVAYDYPEVGNREVPNPWPKVMVVFQQLFLWPHLTLRENILLPLHNSRVDSREIVEDLTRVFDMAEFLDRYPNQVSLGQRQRAALVRALALQPKYLLLDEITSALDMEQVRNVLEHLQKLRSSGVGILLATHFIGFARTAADRVVILQNGAVLESGGPEILENPSEERTKEFLSIH